MSDELSNFATRYAKAWCSQNPESVAAFFAEGGSISINNGPPAVGRAAIAKEAQAFITTFLDMVVTMDKIAHDEQGTKFHWTLTGTNTGPVRFLHKVMELYKVSEKYIAHDERVQIVEQTNDGQVSINLETWKEIIPEKTKT